MSQNKIENPYNFTPEEQQVINTNFNKHSDWDDNSNFDNLKENIKSYLRSEQENLCCYCKIKLRHRRLSVHIDHIVPKGRHKSFTFVSQNLALSCPACNSGKSTNETLVNPNILSYPAVGEDFLIVHPHFDNYFEHITIENQVFIRAITEDKGEKTIEICKLDDIELILDKMEEVIIKNKEEQSELIESLLLRITREPENQELLNRILQKIETIQF